jgi:hypothetical protein
MHNLANPAPQVSHIMFFLLYRDNVIHMLPVSQVSHNMFFLLHSNSDIHMLHYAK